MSSVKVFKAERIVQGKASGPALVTRERVSFKGFIDPEKGIFKGRTTELLGASFAGKVLIFTSAKGSTMWSVMLDLSCRFGHRPAAMVVLEKHPFVVLGCVLQDIPLVQVYDSSIFDQVKSGDTVTVDADKGEVIVGGPIVRGIKGNSEGFYVPAGL
jgi:predicted aconitase with swiveling domain